MLTKYLKHTTKALLIVTLALGWITAIAVVSPTDVSAQDSTNGDADGDGIGDSRDDCPNQFGPIVTNGCPIIGVTTTDTTNEDDGRTNTNNTAPTTPTDLPPDSDGDGTADPMDSCPTTPGDGANAGCPAGQSSDDPTGAGSEPPAESAIPLNPMPTTGACVASPVGTFPVNMRDSWSVDAPINDVLQVNELREVWAVVSTDDAQYPTWYLLPWGYVSSQVIRLGGEDCPNTTPNVANFDLVATNGIETVPHTGILDILCPELEDGSSVPCAEPDQPAMMGQMGQLDIQWCWEDVTEDGDCVEISMSGSLGQMGMLDILCPELEDGSSMPCAQPDQPSMMGQMGQLDILWCWEDVTEDGDCVEISATSLIPQLGMLDILCPELEDGSSVPCAEPDQPAMTEQIGQMDFLWCYEDVADPSLEDCLEVSISGAIPQMGQMDILCPELEDGSSVPCVQLDNPAMIPMPELDILWCEEDITEDGDCVLISTSTSPLMGQLEILCPQNEDGTSGPCVQLNPELGQMGQLDIQWCWEDVTDPSVGNNCVEIEIDLETPAARQLG